MLECGKRTQCWLQSEGGDGDPQEAKRQGEDWASFLLVIPAVMETEARALKACLRGQVSQRVLVWHT